MRILFYRDTDGDWRWRLFARNNRIVADSGEGYKRKFDCFRIAHKLFDHLAPKGF